VTLTQGLLQTGQLAEAEAVRGDRAIQGRRAPRGYRIREQACGRSVGACVGCGRMGIQRIQGQQRACLIVADGDILQPHVAAVGVFGSMRTV
jgi:hypothetical protein